MAWWPGWIYGEEDVVSEEYTARWSVDQEQRCEAVDRSGRRCRNDRLHGQQVCAEHGGITDTARILDKLDGADRSVWMVNGVPKRLSNLTRDERRALGSS